MRRRELLELAFRRTFGARVLCSTRSASRQICGTGWSQELVVILGAEARSPLSNAAHQQQTSALPIPTAAREDPLIPR